MQNYPECKELKEVGKGIFSISDVVFLVSENLNEIRESLRKFVFTCCGYTCRLLITFANSLDQDQAQQHVGPDLDLNCVLHL